MDFQVQSILSTNLIYLDEFENFRIYLNIPKFAFPSIFQCSPNQVSSENTTERILYPGLTVNPTQPLRVNCSYLPYMVFQPYNIHGRKFYLVCISPVWISECHVKHSEILLKSKCDIYYFHLYSRLVIEYNYIYST